MNTIHYHVARICLYCNSIASQEEFKEGVCPICHRMQPQELLQRIEALEKLVEPILKGSQAGLKWLEELEKRIDVLERMVKPHGQAVVRLNCGCVYDAKGDIQEGCDEWGRKGGIALAVERMVKPHGQAVDDLEKIVRPVDRDRLAEALTALREHKPGLREAVVALINENDRLHDRLQRKE